MAEIEIIPDSIIFTKMDDAIYFSEQYKEYISNSKLSLINPDEGGSIEKFEEGFKSEYSSSFELGGAIHASLLQKDLFYISKFIKPGGKLGIFIEEVFKNRKLGYSIVECVNLASISADYYKGKLSSNRLKTALKTGFKYYHYLRHEEQIERKENFGKCPIYLSDSNYSKYYSCIKTALDNSDVTKFVYPEQLKGSIESFNEYAILCDIKVTVGDRSIILKLKGKLDNLLIDHDNNIIIINDLKTTSKPITFFMGNRVKVVEEDKSVWKWFDGSFQKYRYYRQIALYSWLAQCAVQQQFGLIYKTNANMVVLETVPNFQTKVYKVKNAHVKRGIQEFKKLLTDIAIWKMNS